MTKTSPEAPEGYAREIRRHLPPLPRRVKLAMGEAVERHLAERLVDGRPAWLTIARLGPAERVAAVLTEAWLETLDAGHTRAD